MRFAWFRSTFLRLLKFPKIKEGGPNFFGEHILHNIWIIWFPLLYFNFKSFKGRNSSSFIRFQRILHDSRVAFPDFWNFYELNRGDLISEAGSFERDHLVRGCALWRQFRPVILKWYLTFFEQSSGYAN